MSTKTRAVVETILPSTATALERATDRAAGSILSDIPIPLRELWNPATCPVAWLPHLAWALSVDHWEDDWPEARKRAVCAASISLHRRKGTLYSVEQALALINVQAEAQPGDTPYRFDVTLPAPQPTGAKLDEAQYVRTHKLIEATRPARSPYDLILDAKFPPTAYVTSGSVGAVGTLTRAQISQPDVHIKLQPAPVQTAGSVGAIGTLTRASARQPDVNIKLQPAPVQATGSVGAIGTLTRASVSQPDVNIKLQPAPVQATGSVGAIGTLTRAKVRLGDVRIQLQPAVAALAATLGGFGTLTRLEMRI